jgi:O-antigen biosynthesis protein
MPLENSAPNVGIIVVNFHTEAEVLRLLESVRSHHPFTDSHIVLVDNSPGHGMTFPLRARDRYLPQPDNIGFGPACNLGAQATGADFIFLANPDIEFPQSLDRLQGHIHGDVVGACPLIKPPGFFQLRRLPTVGAFAWDFLGMPQAFPKNRRSLRYYYQPVPEAPFAVEQPAAAALLLHRERFLELGGFDPLFAPAWFEDVDLAFRVRARGWTMVCDPRMGIAHAMGVTAEKLGRTGFFTFYGRNCVRYFRKNHGGFRAAVIKAVLFLGFILRTLRGRVSPTLCVKVWGW